MVDAAELVRQFVAASPVAATAPGDDPELAAALTAAVASAQAACPEVALAPERFVAHLARHADEVSRDLWQARAADVWLACACAEGDARAIAGFETRFRGTIDSVLARMRLDGATVDDVRQAVRDRLLVAVPGHAPRIAGYSGRGELAGWVRAAATRVALNLLRAQPKTTSDEELMARVPAASDDPELAMLKARYGPAFRRAFSEALSELELRTRLLLKQHYVDGQSTDDLGALHGVHRVTVLRWLTAAREDLARDVERRLCEGLQVAPRELASLMRLVRSRIELDLNDLLSAHD